MQKYREINDQQSCWNKALFDEYVFVLLGRDPAAKTAIIAWCNERARLGLNVGGDPKLSEALECANKMEEQKAMPRQPPPEKRTVLDLMKQDFGMMTPAEREEIRLALLRLDTSIAAHVGPGVLSWLAAAQARNNPIEPRYTFSGRDVMILRRCVMLAEAVLRDCEPPPEKKARWLVKERGVVVAEYESPQAAVEYMKEHRHFHKLAAEDVTTEQE